MVTRAGESRSNQGNKVGGLPPEQTQRIKDGQNPAHIIAVAHPSTVQYLHCSATRKHAANGTIRCHPKPPESNLHQTCFSKSNLNVMLTTPPVFYLTLLPTTVRGALNVHPTHQSEGPLTCTQPTTVRGALNVPPTHPTLPDLYVSKCSNRITEFKHSRFMETVVRFTSNGFF